MIDLIEYMNNVCLNPLYVGSPCINWTHAIISLVMLTTIAIIVGWFE